jgi:hypothetical protein
MNDYTVVFSNQKAAVSLLLIASVFSAGVVLAAATPSTESTTSASTATAKTGATAVPAGDARDEKRIKEMHDKLQISQAQEPLWATMANTMRMNDDRIEVLATKRHDRAGTTTAVEDLASYVEMSQAHYESAKALHTAFVPLYDSMSVAQRANADIVFRGPGMKGHKKAL